jgi:beta-glucosidase
MQKKPRSWLRKMFMAAGIFIAVLLLLAGTWILSLRFEKRHSVRLQGVRWTSESARLEADKLAEDLLAKMTMDEKISQMSGDGGIGTLLKLGADFFILHRFPYVYSGRNERLGIPPFVFTDGPRGVVLGHATCFPVAMARAASWDPLLQARVGDAIGREARASGANYFGGVCVNLLRHPAWGRAQETYGEDPFLMAEMAVPLIRAVQAHNVMACAKHFALNSIENSRTTVDVRLDDRTLQEVYLPHFRKCVEAGVASVMSAYNKVRGEYCGHSRFLLMDILRNEWKFRGFVTSDWMNEIYDGVKAANAGMDVEMPLAHWYGKKLKSALDSGYVSPAAVDSMVLRILRTKLYYAGRPDTMDYPESLIACEAHRNLAREAAEQGMVLLKNQGNTLPFQRTGIRSLAVIGGLAKTENTGDHGSSWVNPPVVVTALDGFKKLLGDSVRVLYTDGSDAALAARLAGAVDAVVLVVGYVYNDEGENIPTKLRTEATSGWGTQGDRLSLSLKDQDVALIRSVGPRNPRTAAVLIGGSAIVTKEWKDAVPSILMAWYPGMEGGNAIARVVFGEVNPSGKLPFTVPKDAAQLPLFNPFSDTVTYGYYHGYSLFDKTGQEPEFPFGFGLSYTTFRTGSPRILAPSVRKDGTVEVRVDVTNTGSRPGMEVVQMYVRFDRSRVERPKKLLRGFAKVQLAPGETKTVQLSVPVADLAWYNPGTRSWEVEAMLYQAAVGTSSRDQDLKTAAFRVVQLRRATPIAVNRSTDIRKNPEGVNHETPYFADLHLLCAVPASVERCAR